MGEALFLAITSATAVWIARRIVAETLAVAAGTLQHEVRPTLALAEREGNQRVDHGERACPCAGMTIDTEARRIARPPFVTTHSPSATPERTSAQSPLRIPSVTSRHS